MARTAPFARVYVDSLPVRYQKILKELKRNVQTANGQTAILSDHHYATISVENLKSIIGDALYRQLAVGTLRYGYRANEKGERPVLVYSIPMECLSREARQAIGSRIERKRTGSGVTWGNSEISESHLQPAPYTPEVRKQSVRHKRHKPAEDVLHEPCLRKYPRLHALHSVHVHHLVRNDEGRWLCPYCGQSYPSNAEGGLDKDQLLREMLLR